MAVFRLLRCFIFFFSAGPLLISAFFLLKRQLVWSSGDRLFKSSRPKISPGGVQNEKIENPQTLPGYRSGWTISRKNTSSSIGFLFYANGDKIGLAAPTSVSRAPHNTLFELRLKTKKTVNLTIEYLNEKNTCLQTIWNVICPIPSQTEFLGDFCFSSIFHSFRRTKKRQNSEGKIAPWYMAWSYIKVIQRKNRVSSSNNCNKIFGLLKMRNFRVPDKRGPKVKTRHSWSRNLR